MKKRSLSKKVDDFIYHEDVPADVIKEELESAGIDVGAFMGRIHNTIRKAKQQNIIEVANQEKLEAEQRSKSVDVLSLTIEKIKELLNKGANGDFGIRGQELVLAHRNHDGEQSEEELRSLAQDLLLLAGDAHEKDSRNSD